MINVTIKYGLTRSVSTEVPVGTTARDLIRDPNIRASLGNPENVKIVIDGETVPDRTTLSNNDVIVLEKQASQKA